MCVHRIDVVWSKWELKPLHKTEWVYNSMADIEMSNKKAKAINMTLAVIGITKETHMTIVNCCLSTYQIYSPTT